MIMNSYACKINDFICSRDLQSMILPYLQGQDISRYVVQHKYDAFWDYFVQRNAVECSCGAGIVIPSKTRRFSAISITV